MVSLKNRIVTKIENKIIEYKQLDYLEKENNELQLMLSSAKENEFIYNPQFPNHNTPFKLIDFESIVIIKVVEDVVIARTPYETYTLTMKSDEYFFEFMKNLIPVGEITLVGKERLIVNHDFYNYNEDLTNEVDIATIRNSLYSVYGKPKKKMRTTIVANGFLTDTSIQDRQERLVNRYGGKMKYKDGKLQ